MRDLKPPFKFDFRVLLTRAREGLNDRVSGVSIKLPFLTFSVQPEATETKVAKEIVIRLADRRVLNAFECCDGCIDNALASLQKMRWSPKIGQCVKVDSHILTKEDHP